MLFPEQEEEIYDTVIEVLDTRSGTVLARTRIDENALGLVGRDGFYSYAEHSDLGKPKFVVWSVALSGTTHGTPVLPEVPGATVTPHRVLSRISSAWHTPPAPACTLGGVAGTSFAAAAGTQPRHFGAFTRKIAHYVTDLKAIAVRSMTGLPARIVGLEDRGLVHEARQGLATPFRTSIRTT